MPFGKGFGNSILVWRTKCTKFHFARKCFKNINIVGGICFWIYLTVWLTKCYNRSEFCLLSNHFHVYHPYPLTCKNRCIHNLNNVLRSEYWEFAYRHTHVYEYIKTSSMSFTMYKNVNWKISSKKKIEINTKSELQPVVCWCISCIYWIPSYNLFITITNMLYQKKSRKKYRNENIILFGCGFIGRMLEFNFNQIHSWFGTQKWMQT